ncbi:hypothetical protein KSP40_PGU019349 [Platanthera guangdongensis]|uniref:Uncharacterized protein n=1 Tax=Platanthera guangdongensis TaxID=2320717 RepID=A0ABR2MNA6_9ASPA
MPPAAKKMKDREDKREAEKQPLLRRQSTANPGDDEITAVQKAIAQAFQSSAHLATLLPTGTVLAFQVLSPLFTNGGACFAANRDMTAGLLLLCALSCFFLCFTDSFRDSGGKVRYGMATFRGMLVIDGTLQLPPAEAAAYRIKLVDFLHGFMSVLVFTAIAMFDRNTVSCFYESPSANVEQVLLVLPVGIGVLGSAFFVAFPTTRHGLGFPLSNR